MIVYFRDRLRAAPPPLPEGSPWVRHGVGVFETVLHNGRALCHVERHLARATASLRALDLPAPPAGLAEAMQAVVEANGLAERVSRVTLDLGIEREDAPPVPLIRASPYSPPPMGGVALAVEPRRYASPLSRHKTSSALSYWLARRRARAAGAFDAVLLDAGDEVLETTTAALLFCEGLSLVAPASPHRLPSVAAAVIAASEPIAERAIRLAEVAGFRAAFVVNSLIGARPVSRIGDHTLEPDRARAEQLRARVWASD